MKTKVLSLWLISLVMMSFVLSAEKKREINLWQKFFPDNLERLYIIMKDEMVFNHNSQHDGKIYINIGMLEKRLKKFKGKDYSIKEIKIVIHNHRRKNYFTLADYRQYRMLKKYGFKGLFLIYCHRTNKTYDIEDEKKSK